MVRNLMVVGCAALVFAGCAAPDSSSDGAASVSTTERVTTTPTSSSTTSTTGATTITTSVPATTTSTVPAVTHEWIFESGSVLVATPDGVVVVRGVGEEWLIESKVVEEPTLRVFADGEGGIVYQPGVRPGPTSVGSFGPIVHVPEPGAEPRVIAEPWESDLPHEEYEPLKLVTVAEVDGDRVVLFHRDTTEGDHYLRTLHGYSLSTQEAVGPSPAGVDEVGDHCVAWAGDLAVYTGDAEGNSYIGTKDDSGDWIEASVGEALHGVEEFWAGSSACVAPDSDSSVILAYASNWYGCLENQGFRIGRFDVDSWMPVGSVHQIPVMNSECHIETLEAYHDLAAVSTGDGATYVVDLNVGSVTALPVSGAASFVP